MRDLTKRLMREESSATYVLIKFLGEDGQKFKNGVITSVRENNEFVVRFDDGGCGLGK